MLNAIFSSVFTETTAAAFAIIVEAVWFILVQTNFGEKRERKRTPHYHPGVP